jgi:hypothetical protein
MPWPAAACNSSPPSAARGWGGSRPASASDGRNRSWQFGTLHGICNIYTIYIYYICLYYVCRHDLIYIYKRWWSMVNCVYVMYIFYKYRHILMFLWKNKKSPRGFTLEPLRKPWPRNSSMRFTFWSLGLAEPPQNQKNTTSWIIYRL